MKNENRYSAGNRRDAFVTADLGNFLEIIRRGSDESSLALHRFSYNRSHRFRVDMLDEKFIELVRTQDVAIGQSVNFT